MQLRRIAPPYIPPPESALKIVNDAPDFVVVSKPHGLLSVPGRGENKEKCVESYVRNQVGMAYIVHRLDMDTSGLMVLARTPQSRRILARAFQERRVTKHYQALVAGSPSEDSGRVNRAIARYSRQRPLRHLEAGGLEAITDWHCIARNAENGFSRVNLYPQTGRSHQLRLHMQALGHPILGDPFYGDVTRYPRLALHATELAFAIGPDSGVRTFSEAPPF